MPAEIIEFGKYPYSESGEIAPVKWRVLTRRKRGDALLISEYGIDVLPFHSPSGSRPMKPWDIVTWDISSMRSFLNNDFIRMCFSKEEEARLIPVNVKNPPCPINSAMDGGKDTMDRVFLMDWNGAKNWFPHAVDRRCRPTPYADAKSVMHHSDGYCSWWLRTIGLWEQFNPEIEEGPRNMHCFATVWNDGVIDFYGMSAETQRCIRPAIMVRM